MNLASNYARLFREGIQPENIIAYIKAKGHLSLLPQVLRLIERNLERGGDSVVVAKKEDVPAALEHFPNARVSVDSRVVGGYLAKVGGKVIDTTYRRALVALYRRATGS